MADTRSLDMKTKRQETDEKKLIPTFVGLAAMFLILLVIFYFLLVSEPETENHCTGEIGGYCYGDPARALWIEESTPTSISLQFGGGIYEMSPTNFELSLGNSTGEGTYIFPSSDNGTVLVLVSGDNMGTIWYLDYAQNGKINVGDGIVMENLEPNSYYALELIYIPSDSEACFYCFSTPSM